MLFIIATFEPVILSNVILFPMIVLLPNAFRVVIVFSVAFEPDCKLTTPVKALFFNVLFTPEITVPLQVLFSIVLFNDAVKLDPLYNLLFLYVFPVYLS